MNKTNKSTMAYCIYSIKYNPGQKLPINAALAYLRITEKNSVQLGNLHHPDIYDLDRQLSLTFPLSHSRLRACMGGEWRSCKERGRKPEQRKSKRL